jgi:hypothetical protein
MAQMYGRNERAGSDYKCLGGVQESRHGLADEMRAARLAMRRNIGIVIGHHF